MASALIMESRGENGVIVLLFRWRVHGRSLVLRRNDRALYHLFGAAKLAAATAFAA